MLISLQQITHSLNGGGRRLEGDDVFRSRPAGQKGKKFSPKAGSLRSALLQTELKDFFQVVPFRLHLPGEFVRNIYRQLYRLYTTARNIRRQFGFVKYPQAGCD
jgi:hypothetical protein